MAVNTYFKSLYDRVVKYSIKAECCEPLHIGSNTGEKGGMLIHSVSGLPFLQATGIAGAFRDFYSYDEKLQKELFGTQEDEDISGSKVRFSDGFFDHASVYTELRPRVRIDRKTGTCQSNSVNGGTVSSGQKFEMEVVSAGSVFSFDIYLYEKERNYQADLEKALAALHHGTIQFGGQKSNGCGYISLKTVEKTVYDMKDQQDRILWQDESKKGENIILKIKNAAGTVDERIHYELSGRTEGSILVKSVFVREYGESAPDAENIRNHRKEYIIPASSIKGVVRSQIERICAYKNIDKKTIDMIFGKAGDKSGEDGILGCVRFHDCIIGDVESNDRIPAQARIHIDKFTGGVMNQGLFSEKPAGGEIHIKADITRTGDDRAKALLLLALRDIGIGMIPLGSGGNIGRGYIQGDTLNIRQGEKQIVELNFADNRISGDIETVNGYLAALQ